MKHSYSYIQPVHTELYCLKEKEVGLDSNMYFHDLNKQVFAIIERHPQIEKWLASYPWLTGSLGNPFSGIWFMAENPSITRVEHVSKRDPASISIESQWSESEGDKLFRKMLVKHGFKQGEPLSASGWNCYITDLIKQPDYAKDWGAKTRDEQNAVALVWSDVLLWELANSNPKLVVVMGKRTRQLLDFVSRERNVQLPFTLDITHYAYIGSRYDNRAKLNAMAPERIAAYDQEFTQVERLFHKL